jgi:hypothetical protein
MPICPMKEIAPRQKGKIGITVKALRASYSIYQKLERGVSSF